MTVERFRPYYFDPVTITGHSATMRANSEGDWVRYEDFERLDADAAGERIERESWQRIAADRNRVIGEMGQEIERLRTHLFEHACQCGCGDPNPMTHAEYCQYRVWCLPPPQQTDKP